METLEQPIEPSPQGQKVLYTERAIAGATFLGGPLAATYLIAHNFNTMGNGDAFKRTWLIGILVTAIAVPVMMTLPELAQNSSTGLLVEMLWAIPAYLVVHKFQQHDIASHLAAGGFKGSGWKAAGVGLLSLAVYLGYAVVMAYAMSPHIAPIPPIPSTSVRMDYSGCAVYYDTSAISSSDAKVVGAILEKIGYFDPRTPENDALFYRLDGEYVVAFGIEPQGLHNPEVEKEINGALNELHGSYSDRRYCFRLLAMDSTGITAERFIRLK
jgi:hypothetical protein